MPKNRNFDDDPFGRIGDKEANRSHALLPKKSMVIGVSKDMYKSPREIEVTKAFSPKPANRPSVSPLRGDALKSYL